MLHVGSSQSSCLNPTQFPYGITEASGFNCSNSEGTVPKPPEILVSYLTLSVCHLSSYLIQSFDTMTVSLKDMDNYSCFALTTMAW